MYSRRLSVKGSERVLTFGHEGVLYRDAFVMYDHGTETKWNHATGRALSGPLIGHELKALPSQMTRWGYWKKRYPESKVLLDKSYTGFFDTILGLFDSYLGDYEGPTKPGQHGISIGFGQHPTLYPFDVLQESPVINDTIRKQTILVVFDPTSQRARAFSRRLNGRTLKFKYLKTTDQKTIMVDRETGSRWNALTAEATKGPLKGSKLKSIVATTWKISKWKPFHPDGSVYETKQSPSKNPQKSKTVP